MRNRETPARRRTLRTRLAQTATPESRRGTDTAGNRDRIWIDRVERDVRGGRQNVTKSVFNLHVIRSTESGTTYEDTTDHLSEKVHGCGD